MAILAVHFFAAVAGAGRLEGQEQAPPAASAAPTEVARLRLHSVLADLLPSPDGKFVYVLDLSEAKVRKLDVADLRVVLEAEVPDDSVAMALTPDGSTLCVAAWAEPRTPDPGPLDAREGILQVLPTATLRASSSIRLPGAPLDVEAADDGSAYISLAFREKLVLADWRRGGLVREPATVRSRSLLRLHPDHRRLYLGSQGLSPGRFTCLHLPSIGAKQPIVPQRPPVEGRPEGGFFELSPDGRLLFGCDGTVLRLSTDRENDLLYAGSIDPFIAIGLAPGCPVFYTSGADGKLREYGYDTLQLRRILPLGCVWAKMVLDSDGTHVTVLECRPSPVHPTDEFRVRPYAGSRLLAAGDVVRYRILR
ncbi:MAG: hypothetical protein HYZ53_10505 [Planctomycetes bacterium]|nr:hypothetical protein [Planctomycetota bacterium]